MTYDELKAEANRQGYNLVKKPIPLPKLRPCTCGRQKLETWFWGGGKGYFYKCPRCGHRGVIGATIREAREGWNTSFEVKENGEQEHEV